MMILANILAFCFYYWQTWSSFQTKKNKLITPSKYCGQAHLFSIKMNVNLIANEVLSLDSWQTAILTLSAKSLDFVCVCVIFLTWFRE
jgi:hypothetical protein